MAWATKIQARPLTSGAVDGSGQRTLAYSGAVTAHSLLVCAVQWNSVGSTVAVSDSVNGAWTAVGSPQNGSDGMAAYRSQLFFKSDSGAGTPTVTFDSSGTSHNLGAAIGEWASPGAAAIDNAQAFYNTATNTVTTHNSTDVTNTVADCLVIGCNIIESTVTAVTGGALLLTPNTWNDNGFAEWILTGTGTQHFAWSVSGGAPGPDSIMGIVAFKHSAAGGPTNTVAPAITGTPLQGQTLTCDTGTWTP